MLHNRLICAKIFQHEARTQITQIQKMLKCFAVTAGMSDLAWI